MPEDKAPPEEKIEEPVKKKEPVKAEPKSPEVETPPEKEELEIVEPKKEEEVVEEEEEGVYKVKPKPELTKEEKEALSRRAVKRRKKPKFRRQEWFRYVRVGDSWRKPRGMHSKARRNYRYRAPKVSKGYRGPRTARGKHSSGFEDVLVHSPKQLDGLDPKRQAARIGHTVGTRKRIAIKEKADDMGIRILNWGRS
jgi:large subunit ribosomal protein L32e